MNKLLLILLFSLLATSGFSQWTEEEKQQIIEERIEYIAQDLEAENIDFTTLFDNLDLLLDNPINLNEASEDVLRESMLFNDIQVAGILAHRRRYGKFISIFELKYVDGFNKSNIEFNLPFIIVEDVAKKDKLSPERLLRGRHTLLLRTQRVMETSVAYSPADSNSSPNSRYLGNPNRMYARWRYQASRNLSVGLTGEKDPGEQFFQGTQKNGFDFYSAHLALSNIGPLKTFIVGDYQAQFGQGLVLWTGFGFRKSSQQALNTRRFARGFVPYTSVDENNFMRGASGTFSLNRIEASLFYSSKLIDANLDTSSVNDLGESSFTSFQQSGFHRTTSELFDKDAIREDVFGANVDYRMERIRIGVTAISSNLQGSFDPNPQLYNKFSLAPNQNTVAGAHYEWTTSAFQVYGEYAVSENGATAQMHGISLNAREVLKLNILYRNKEPSFQNNYANSFGERSVSANEKGWYHGLELLPFKNMSIQAYLDLYEFPWLSFRSDRPSGGYESSLFARYIVTRKFNISALYRAEERERNSQEPDLRNRQVSKEKLEQYRLQFDYKANSELSFRSRIEYRRYYIGEQDIEEGYMIYQDLGYSHPSSKWDLRFRYAIYSTSSYNTRIYAYENDMRYQFTVPAYFGEGSRSYILFNYKPVSNLTLSFRLAQSFRSDEEGFGSGSDAIEGPRKTEVKTQLLYKF